MDNANRSKELLGSCDFICWFSEVDKQERQEQYNEKCIKAHDDGSDFAQSVVF